jgi:hypothetical protein
MIYNKSNKILLDSRVRVAPTAEALVKLHEAKLGLAKLGEEQE